MLIATRHTLTSLKKASIDLFINGYKLANVPVYMLLGITITHDLKWNKNIDQICKKILNKIFALRKLFFNAYVKNLL